MGLYFYKKSPSSTEYPYSENVTKNCRLTVTEIDSNFATLQDSDIKSLEFDCEAKTLTLVRNDGKKLHAVDMSCALSGLPYNFDVTLKRSEKGNTGDLKFEWDEDGEHKVKVINNISLSGIYIDSTLVGQGTQDSLLGLNPVEETGHYKPVKNFIDLANGAKLPSGSFKGERYLTKEYIDDYGYLYTLDGAKKIKLSDGWRIPTKEDWDNVLDNIENKCYTVNYLSHYSPKCHVELGQLAGKFLRHIDSQASAKCDCDCCCDSDIADDTDEPIKKPIPTNGIDKFGFTVLSAGYATDYGYHHGKSIEGFGNVGSFWTNTTTNGDDGNYYVKNFFNTQNGVYQTAECPTDYHSLRLVKDYDGSNFEKSTYINGHYYEEVLMPSNTDSKYSIWTKTNISIIDGLSNDDFATYSDYYTLTNSLKKRAVYVINDWNGYKWNRKELVEGSIIVINAKQDKDHDENTEYMVTRDDNGELTLTATNDLKLERFDTILSKYEEKLNAESEARETADQKLSGAIDTINNSISGLESSSSAINKSLSAIDDALSSLTDNLSSETQNRISADTAIQENIDSLSGALDTLSGKITNDKDELNGKLLSGGTYTLNVASQLIIPSNDGKNNITIAFDGNFGEIK